MSSLFKSILIPVDFSVNTEVAVKQAIELASADGSTIHLVHVIKPKIFWRVIPIRIRSFFAQNENFRAQKIMSKLQEWKYAIEESVPYCKVRTYVVKGAVCGKIEDAAREIKPQLIIIGKSKYHKYCSWFTPICPNGLAKSTGYPVLTVMVRMINPKIKIIVVPVGSFIPTRKIELVIEFAKRYRAAIHLVTSPNNIDLRETNGNSFLETYRILKTGLTNPIEHHILKGNNLAKAILEYAERVGADLMLVNPGSETRISSITGRHINDALTKSSKLKVLSIEPYRYNEVPVFQSRRM